MEGNDVAQLVTDVKGVTSNVSVSVLPNYKEASGVTEGGRSMLRDDSGKENEEFCSGPYTPDLPNIEIIPNVIKPGTLWKKSERLVSEIERDINLVYEKIVYFKQNLMPLPAGAVTKELIGELTYWLKHLNEPSSQFNAFAMKAFMIIPDLLLQKPTRTSKAKDNTSALKRRLEEWKNGNIVDLLKEGQHIQDKFNKYNQTHRSNENTAKIFARLISQGKINAAMKLLENATSDTGMLEISNDVIEELKKKHPDASPIEDPESLLHGPIPRCESYIYDEIDEQTIRRASMKTKGSAGPSGVHADLFRSILCSNRHRSQSKELREQISLLTRNMLIHAFHPKLIEPLVACRLIPLAKKPSGVRPIGVGETLRRIMGKAVSWILKEEIKTAAGPLQTCANHGAGAEAAIHGMRSIFEKDSTEAVLLIDAKNAFNSLNRSAALHNIRILCPPLATYIVNTYRNPCRLFISGKDGGKYELPSQEGTTQGDPLAMGWYAITTKLMIKQSEVEDVAQVWLADDAAAGGKLENLHEWYEKLVICGRKWGYLVNGGKSWLIVKPEKEGKAREIFGDKVNITIDGKRHLGAVLGSKSYKDEYATNMINEWIKQFNILCEIAKTQPQAAYIGYKRGFSSKFTYFQRTIPDFEKYLNPVQEILETKFIPTLFGYDTPLSSDLLKVLSLPVKYGGLGLANVVEESPIQFEGSLLITSLQTTDIINQSTGLSVFDNRGFTQKDKICQHIEHKAELLKEKIRSLDETLPQELLQFTQRARDKGSGSWLNALPLEKQGFSLSKTEFRDGLKLRYNLPITDVPTYCVCGERFNTVHALSCKKGGFVSQRHDNIRDMFTSLLDKCCTNVQAEPHLTDLQGETFNYRTANTSSEARLDIRARNFWRQGQDSFFDIRVTHVNALSHQDLTTEAIFKRQENEKKRQYNQRIIEIEHGSFTPLIIGTNGGMGRECQLFLKNLADMLARKQSEDYAPVITWLRTKLSFEVLRSTVLCLRGSRRPWRSNKPIITDDFGLHVHEAGLNVRE